MAWRVDTLVGRCVLFSPPSTTLITFSAVVPSCQSALMSMKSVLHSNNTVFQVCTAFVKALLCLSELYSNKAILCFKSVLLSARHYWVCLNCILDGQYCYFTHCNTMRVKLHSYKRCYIYSTKKKMLLGKKLCSTKCKLIFFFYKWFLFVW